MDKATTANCNNGATKVSSSKDSSPEKGARTTPPRTQYGEGGGRHSFPGRQRAQECRLDSGERLSS